MSEKEQWYQATDWHQSLEVNVRCPKCGCYVEVKFDRKAYYGDDLTCPNCFVEFELGDPA